ncbi:MAG: TIGR01777 family oxidoreductase [Bacteroidales bacterium]|jgi:uncharacterized protein (TIGR01777 family)|nr:TIGR01777 family oxidoreductase [Bacteroidales bacterium]
MQRVVITGGNGLIGRHLSSLLMANGYEVAHLSRTPSEDDDYRSYLWDPQSGYCDSAAFHDGDAIIHLAGANIGSRRWSRARKREIISSRVESAGLIYNSTVIAGKMPSVFITASATGIYGSIISDRIHLESDPPSDDFLAETCRLWEEAADRFTDAGIRVVKVRCAVVLSARGSALSKLTAPAGAGLIVRLGPGNQYFPWIHIDDLCRIYLKAVNDNAMAGPYNASAPQHITHDMLMREIARQRQLPVILPRIPAWLLRLILGEMAVALTTGSRISSSHITGTGYSFTYPDITSALEAC